MSESLQILHALLAAADFGNVTRFHGRGPTQSDKRLLLFADFTHRHDALSAEPNDPRHAERR